MGGHDLGRFDHLLLLAVMRLGDAAYGMTIRRELAEHTGREVAAGAIYTALARLEARGYVQSHLGDGDFSKIPNGAPGVETRMSLVYDGGVRAGKISMNRFVELTSTSPAKIFGMFPKKGTIAPGSDADIVIFDPNRTTTLGVKTLHMKVDYNPYEGRQVTGVTETVLSRGKVVIDQGTFVGRAGAGSFLKRSPR